MFKISYMDIRSQAFRTAFGKLSDCDGFADFKVGYNIMRMLKILDKALKASNEEWARLVTKLVVINEKGEASVKNGDFEWKEGVDPAAGRAEFEAFGNTEVTIDRLQLRPEDLKPAKLSPAELSAIYSLLEDMA